MANAVLENWEEGTGLSEEQVNPLGVRVADPDDGTWVYGRFVGNGTYHMGMPVRNAKAVDSTLQNAAAGSTVTTASAKGNNKLICTGAFVAARYVEGALGTVYDGTGEGQNFYVVRKIDDNTAEIVCQTSETKRSTGNGWETALDTTSKYRLRFPGQFHLSAGGATEENVGLYQGNELTVTDDYKPYGWVKCEGEGFGLVDASGTAGSKGGYLVPTTGSLLIGATAANGSIGRLTIVEAYDATHDYLVRVAIETPNWGISQANVPAGSRHPYNRVKVGL